MTANDDVGCPDWEVGLHGALDGEVDSMHALAFQAHLATCATCREEIEGMTALRRVMRQDGVAWRMPGHVRAQIFDAIAREERTTRLAGEWRGSRTFRFIRDWSFVPSLAALFASIALFLAAPRQNLLADEILSSHRRSLLVDHVTDVQTSDRHTVKPWFNGKAGFSPPVADLAADGFRLIGGRLDDLGNQTVPVVVYQRREHVINVFMWPAETLGAPNLDRQGFHVLSWTVGDITFCAVSDVSAEDLQLLRRALMAAAS